MRLKQLLGITLLAMVAMATASASQLSGVLVKNHDNTGTVTILANGTFTHTEYRPTDNLMLVDLAGVSLAHPDTKVHAVFAPGVRSYRIVSYRSPEGSEVARVERHAELRAHAHGIGAVAFGVAFAEALVLFPVLHEQAADGVTGALQQHGGDRGIHATGHADDDVHGASSRQARLANSERLPAR